MRRPTLSLVLPLRNDAEEVKDLETHLSSWLSAYEIECEIVLVDDGSTDDTRPRAEAWSVRDPRVKVVPLLHPYGVEGALRAGLDHATGEAIVLVDGDIQDSAEVIPRLVEQWRAGADLVHARRRPTQVERGAKSWVRRSIHELTDTLTRNGVPQDAGNFRLVDHSVALRLKALTDSARNLRGLLGHVARVQRSVTFESVPSRRRKSLSLAAELDAAFESITRRSLVPLRLAYVVAAVLFGAGLLALLLMLMVAAASHTPIRSWLWISAILGILGGVQLFFVGVAGEYLGRMFLDLQKLPPYALAGALPVQAPVAHPATPEFAPIPAPEHAQRPEAVSLADSELEAVPAPDSPAVEPTRPPAPVRASTPPPPRLTPAPGQMRAVTTAKNTLKIEPAKSESKPPMRPSNPPLPSKRASVPPAALGSKPKVEPNKSAPPPAVVSDRPPPSFMTNAGPSSVGARTKTLAGIPLPAMLAYAESTKSDVPPASKRDLSPPESAAGTGDDDATKVGVVPADIERLKEEPKLHGTLHGIPGSDKG